MVILGAKKNCASHEKNPWNCDNGLRAQDDFPLDTQHFSLISVLSLKTEILLKSSTWSNC